MLGSACPKCGMTIRELGFLERGRILNARRRTRERQEPPPTPPSQKTGASDNTIAMFRASEYLANRECQKLMLELSRNWKGRDPAIDARIAQFHPLTLDDIKQAPELEAYTLQSIGGTLNRVHLVIKSKIASLNPPPEDSVCESCHRKGWLQKEYQTSKLDGANAAVWLCTDCASAGASNKPPLRKLDDIERPKTKVPALDDNPKLMDLMFDMLERGVAEVKKTPLMSPFAVLETFASSRTLQTFNAERLDIGYEDARRAILAAPPEARRYALAWLGYTTIEGVRYETVYVEGGERGDEKGAAIGQRYKQHLPEVNCEPIGNPMVIGPSENLLTLATDPDAITKLRPQFVRLKADMAHNQGPGHDEALSYEIKKGPAVLLDLRDLDRPFRKELQKAPDIVQVILGRRSWVTFFNPEANEVVLNRETLVPGPGEPLPFPGFTEDGAIMIGYAPPSSSLKGPGKKDYVIFVLWISRFKVTDKES
jgi:hypothetical protein